MNEYRRIVDEMNAAMLSETEARALNEQYTAAVQEINRRLRECDDRLRKGHRSEAIQLSEAEPNLLDSVATLDFHGRETWVKYIRRHDLPAPPQLLIDVAREISEAYAIEQTLGGLLRLHRLHALARGPLRRRIEIMRKIARADRQNPVWDADLRIYERARADQIAKEVEHAGRHADLVGLAELERELRSPDWRHPPLPPVMRRASELHTRLRAAQARTDLERLAHELSAAHAELDVARGRLLRERWRARAAIGISNAQDPLLEWVAPAMEWLDAADQQERARAEHEVAVEELRLRLDKGADRDAVEHAYRAVARSEGELPVELERRRAEQMRSFERAERRRFWLIGSGVGVGVLLLAVLIATALFYRARRQEVATHVAALAALLDDGRLTEAGQYLAGLAKDAPWVFRYAEAQEQRTRWVTACNDEEDRKRRLDELLDGIQRELERTVTWESLGRVENELLSGASEVSKLEEEKHRVKQLALQLAAKRSRLQQDEDDPFRKALEELRSRAAGVPTSDRAAMEKLIQEARALQARPRVSTELKKQIEPVIDRLNALVAAYWETAKEGMRLRELTDAVGNRERYRLALEAYTKEFGDTPRALHFGRVALQESETWAGIERWDALIQKWSQEDLRRVAPDKAAALLKEANSLLENAKGFAAAGALEALKPYLEAVARRADPGDSQSLCKKLEAVLHNSTVSALRAAESRDGKRYYFLGGDPSHLLRGWSIYYFTGFDLNAKSHVNLPAEKIANPPTDGGFDWTSPQARFSKFALDQLARLDQAGWESTFVVILTALHKERRMEPILKVQLTKHVMDVACQGSHCLTKVLDSGRKLIDSIQIDESANWIDPENRQAASARETAARALQRMPDPQDACTELASELARLNRPNLGGRLQWVGWLCQIEPGAWTCEIPSRLASAEPAELFVAYREAADQPVKLVKIGTRHEGTVTVPSVQQGALLEGRPVYASSPAQPAANK